MLYTKASHKAFLVLEKQILSVLPYIGMAAILFNDAEPFEKKKTRKKNNCQLIPFHSKPRVKSSENWSFGFREERLKITQFYTCIHPRGKAPRDVGGGGGGGGKFFIVNKKKLYYLNHTL